MMSELERLDEALEWATALTEHQGERTAYMMCALIEAARAYRDLLANGQRVEPNYEAAAQAILVDEAMYQKPGQEVVMKDRYRRQARVAVDAALVGLSVYPKEAENGD